MTDPLRVLVTGATGYVGSRLVPRLLADGHEVSVGSRSPDSVATFPWADRVRIRALDVADRASVREATRDVDVLVYLVHSLADRDFVDLDSDGAWRVAAAARDSGVGRIVYLSGLVPDDPDLSDHLRSRLEVEQVFTGSGVATTVLRAAVVVGAGSTSFEVLRRSTERLPVVPLPTWLDHLVQPVAVADVLEVLSVATAGRMGDRAYDVGGAERLSYADLVGTYADVAGLRRPRVRLPGAPTGLAGRATALLTGMSPATVGALVESLDHDMVCDEDDVLDCLPEGFTWTPLRDAIRRSLVDAVPCDGTHDPQAPSPTDREGPGRRG